jgi:hypothetical protein
MSLYLGKDEAGMNAYMHILRRRVSEEWEEPIDELFDTEFLDWLYDDCVQVQLEGWMMAERIMAREL